MSDFRIEHGVSARLATLLHGAGESCGPLRELLCELVAEIESLRKKVHRTEEIARARDIAIGRIGSSPWFARVHDTLVVDARFPLRGEDGFHKLEFGVDGRPFRWTGPENTFGFLLPLDRSRSLGGEIVLPGSAVPEFLSRLALFVDGEEHELHPAPERHAFTFVVPPRAAPGATQLTFFTGGVIPACELRPDSDDRRPLGVVFSTLKVFPEERGTAHETSAG